MPPPLAPPGSPICSSPCIHHSRSGSDPFWMSLVASVASQDLHSRHLHSVWAALGLPHRHKVSALTPNWFRPLRWAGQDSCRGASSRCHICCWHIFLLHPGQPRTRANRPDPSRRRIRTPDPDCCEWVISAPLAASCCAAGVPRSIGCRSAENCPKAVYRLGPTVESSTSPLALVRHLS